ncbi:hypothetical protein PCE1_002514 [Barthelona sp. PCE]
MNVDNIIRRVLTGTHLPQIDGAYLHNLRTHDSFYTMVVFFKDMDWNDLSMRFKVQEGVGIDDVNTYTLKQPTFSELDIESLSVVPLLLCGSLGIDPTGIYELSHFTKYNDLFPYFIDSVTELVRRCTYIRNLLPLTLVERILSSPVFLRVPLLLTNSKDALKKEVRKPYLKLYRFIVDMLQESREKSSYNAYHPLLPLFTELSKVLKPELSRSVKIIEYIPFWFDYLMLLDLAHIHQDLKVRIVLMMKSFKLVNQNIVEKRNFNQLFELTCADHDFSKMFFKSDTMMHADSLNNVIQSFFNCLLDLFITIFFNQNIINFPIDESVVAATFNNFFNKLLFLRIEKYQLSVLFILSLFFGLSEIFDCHKLFISPINEVKFTSKESFLNAIRNIKTSAQDQSCMTALLQKLSNRFEACEGTFSISKSICNNSISLLSDILAQLSYQNTFGISIKKLHRLIHIKCAKVTPFPYSYAATTAATAGHQTVTVSLPKRVLKQKKQTTLFDSGTIRRNDPGHDSKTAMKQRKLVVGNSTIDGAAIIHSETHVKRKAINTRIPAEAKGPVTKLGRTQHIQPSHTMDTDRISNLILKQRLEKQRIVAMRKANESDSEDDSVMEDSFSENFSQAGMEFDQFMTKKKDDELKNELIKKEREDYERIKRATPVLPQTKEVKHKSEMINNPELKGDMHTAPAHGYNYHKAYYGRFLCYISLFSFHEFSEIEVSQHAELDEFRMIMDSKCIDFESTEQYVRQFMLYHYFETQQNLLRSFNDLKRYWTTQSKKIKDGHARRTMDLNRNLFSKPGILQSVNFEYFSSLDSANVKLHDIKIVYRLKKRPTDDVVLPQINDAIILSLDPVSSVFNMERPQPYSIGIVTEICNKFERELEQWICSVNVFVLFKSKAMQYSFDRYITVNSTPMIQPSPSTEVFCTKVCSLSTNIREVLALSIFGRRNDALTDAFVKPTQFQFGDINRTLDDSFFFRALRIPSEKSNFEIVSRLLNSLNDTQKRAMKHIFSSGATLPEMVKLIIGPPGTGKTMFSAHCLLLKHFSNAQNNMGARRTAKQAILVCAPSNAATDELLRKLSTLVKEMNIKSTMRPKMLRVGVANSVSPLVMQHEFNTLVNLAQQGFTDPFNHQDMENVRKKVEELQEMIEKEQEKRDILTNSLKKEREVFRSMKNSTFQQSSLPQQRNKIHNLDIQVSKLNTALKVNIEKKKSLVKSMRRTAKVSNAEARKHVLQSADIVFTTLSSSGIPFMYDEFETCHTSEEIRSTRSHNPLKRFSMILIDEAAQSTELGLHIPMQYVTGRTPTTVVLVGDHNQLPATILTKQISTYKRSLFERFIQAGVPHIQFDEQYRMHEDIVHFPANMFYAGDLRSSDAIVQRERPAYLATTPVYTVLNVEGREHGEHGGFSRGNPAEVCAVMRIIAKIVKNIVTVRALDIDVIIPKMAIITPYKKQQNDFRDVFRNLVSSNPTKCRQKLKQMLPMCGNDVIFMKLLPVLKELLRNTFIQSIDSVQGGEFDIVLYSVVKSNPNARFIDDPQRVCVALTRARHALFVVCNGPALVSTKIFKALLDDAEQRGCIESMEFDEDDTLDPYEHFDISLNSLVILTALKEFKALGYGEKKAKSSKLSRLKKKTSK